MDQSLAEIQSARQRLVQLSIVLRVHLDLCHWKLNGVLFEARQPRPLRSRNMSAIHPKGFEAFLGSPLGQVRVITLTGNDERREQGNGLSLVVAQQAGRDGSRALRLNRNIAVGAMLCSQLYVQQPQE